MISTQYLNLNKEIVKPQCKILGLIGRRRSGKDYTAKVLTSLDLRFQSMSLASPLKEELAKELNIGIEKLDHPVDKERYRRSMQVFSLKKKAEGSDFYFINLLLQNAPKDRLLVIPDVRFISELQAIVMSGGTVYKVHAEQHMRSNRGWRYDPTVDEDPSESELGDVPGDTLRECCDGGTIYNTRGEDYLAEQLAKIVKKHFPLIPPNFYKELEGLKDMEI